MKKRSKILIMTGVLGITMGILIGCGGSGAVRSSDSKKEITFWNPFTGPDGSNMQAMIDEYNKTNPEYTVKNTSFKETDMYVKIPTVVNSGKNAPDLTIVHAERIKQYQNSDMLITYDEYLTEFPEIKAENYVPEAWNIGEINGERYSVPLDIHTFGLYYNKDLVDQYAPSALDDNIVTFEEIKEAGEKAKSDQIAALGVTWMKPNYLSLFAQYGGELSENGIDPTLNTIPAKESFGLWNEYAEAGYTTKDGEDPWQLFLTGKVIFCPEGIWMQNQAKESDINWGLTNAPQLSDDLSKAVNWSSSHQFVIFQNKEQDIEKVKGTIKFLDWVRDNSLEWAKSGQNPASLALLENEEYIAMPQSIFVLDKAEQQTLKIFDYKYNGYVSEYLDKQAVDIVFGIVSIEDSLIHMQKEVSDKIAKDGSNK